MNFRRFLRFVRLAGAARGDQCGFTLVELLASLAIAAAALALIGSNVQLLASGWNRHTARLQQSDELLRGARILRRDLRAIRRVSEGEPDAQTLSFAGNHRSVRFVTLEPDYPAQAGLAFVRYYLSKGSSGIQLIRQRARFTENTLIAAIDFEDPIVIFEDVSELQFGYLSDTPGRTGWTQRWSDPVRLPALVRIRAVRRGGAAIPDIVVRLDIDAEPECTRDNGPPCTIDSRLRDDDGKPERSR